MKSYVVESLITFVLFMALVVCICFTGYEKETYSGCPQYLRVKGDGKVKEARDQSNCRPYGDYDCKDDPYVPCPGAPYTAKNWRTSG